MSNQTRKGNNIHPLIQEGDISKTGRLAAIGKMVAHELQKG